MKFLIIHGPNLNLLGLREPDIYGTMTYSSLCSFIAEVCEAEGVEADFFQSNHEGSLIDAIHAAYHSADAIIINPGAYAHTSIAILDALKSVALPAIEVHLTDIHSREPFRHHSYTALACREMICGRGAEGYRQAVQNLKQYLMNR